MRTLLKRVAFAAIGFAVAAMVRNLGRARGGAPHALETWENEGGAVPDREDSRRPRPMSS
jgi:hypothetical protein